jgi:hypothetical protein
MANRPILIKDVRPDGIFTLSCNTKDSYADIRKTMLMRGLFPVNTYTKATETGSEYVLVYNVNIRFQPICLN